jgi:hypothetical protein
LFSKKDNFTLFGIVFAFTLKTGVTLMKKFLGIAVVLSLCLFAGNAWAGDLFTELVFSPESLGDLFAQGSIADKAECVALCTLIVVDCPDEDRPIQKLKCVLESVRCVQDCNLKG